MPTFSSGSRLRDDLRRRFGVLRQMMAEKDRIGDLHQRIIDLEIKDMPHATPLEPVEQTGVGQRRQCAAVTVRAEEQLAGLLQQ